MAATAGPAALHRKMEALQSENENLILRMKYLQTVGDVYRKKIRLLIATSSQGTPDQQCELSRVLTSMDRAENCVVSSQTMQQIINDGENVLVDEVRASQSHADVASYWKDQFLWLVKDTSSVDDALLVRRLMGEKEELVRKLSAVEAEAAAVRQRNEQLEEEAVLHARNIKACERRTAEGVVEALQRERTEADLASQRDSRRKLTALNAKLCRAEESLRLQAESFETVLQAMRSELAQQKSIAHGLQEKLMVASERILAGERELAVASANLEKEKATARSAEAAAAAAQQAAADGAAESAGRVERLREQVREALSSNEGLHRDLQLAREALSAANLKARLASASSAAAGTPLASSIGTVQAEPSPQHLLEKLTRAMQSVESQNFTLGGGLRDLTTQLDNLDSARRDAAAFQERCTLLSRQLRILRDECTRAAKLRQLELLQPESLQRALMAATLPPVDDASKRESFVQEKEGFRMFRDQGTGTVFFVTTNPLETPFGPQQRVLRQIDEWAEVLVTKTQSIVYTTPDIDATPFGTAREVVLREYKGFREVLRRDTNTTFFVTDDINRTSFGVPTNERIVREAEGVAEIINTDTEERYFKTSDVRWTPFHKREVELRECDGFREVLRDDGTTIYVTGDVDRTPFGTATVTRSKSSDAGVDAPSLPILAMASTQTGDDVPIRCAEEPPSHDPVVEESVPTVSVVFHVARCTGLVLPAPDTHVFVVASFGDPPTVLLQTTCPVDDPANPAWERSDALFDVSFPEDDSSALIRLELWATWGEAEESKKCIGVATVPVVDVAHEESGSRSYQLQLDEPGDEPSIIFLRFARAS